MATPKYDPNHHPKEPPIATNNPATIARDLFFWFAFKYDCTHSNTTITDNNSNGISSVMNITNNLNVEQVQIKVIITHPRSGEVGLELTSPNGTKSILKYVNDSFLIDDDANLNMVLLSNAFYGESSQGNWTLKVIDGKNGNTGLLSRWKMNIIGHTP